MTASRRATAFLLLAFAVRPAAAEPALDAHFVRLLRRAAHGLAQDEVAAWLLREPDGRDRLVLWPPTNRPRSHAWRGPVPAGAIALLHTHPASGNPLPSAPDRDVARRFGLPVYTISRWAIYRVDRDEVMRPVSSPYWRPTIDWALADGVGDGALERTELAAGSSVAPRPEPEAAAR